MNGSPAGPAIRVGSPVTVNVVDAKPAGMVISSAPTTVKVKVPLPANAFALAETVIVEEELMAVIFVPTGIPGPATCMPIARVPVVVAGRPVIDAFP